MKTGKNIDPDPKNRSRLLLFDGTIKEVASCQISARIS